MSATTVTAVAASAAIANATKASGWMAKRHTFLTSHRGLAFYTSSKQPLDLGRPEVVITKSIGAPT
jgi:hypothetical protein